MLVNVTARGNRVASALWFALSILCFALPMNAHAGLVLLYEGLAATLLFLLIPSRFLRGKRLCSDEAAQEDAAVRRKIAASAAALRELYDSIARPRTMTEENPAAIFDRAAEKVCRGCALCSYCWEKEYQRTYTALNDATAALLRRRAGQGRGFPLVLFRAVHPFFVVLVGRERRAARLSSAAAVPGGCWRTTARRPRRSTPSSPSSCERGRTARCAPYRRAGAFL